MLNEQLQRRLMLIILDGFGTAKASEGNAVTMAEPKNLIKLWNAFPHTYLRADSEYVGLPQNTRGNSEVGHLNLGSGNVIYQSLPKINRSIEKGDFFSNKTLIEALNNAVTNGSNIHLLGCLSDGSVHSHINHFKATLKFLKDKGFNKSVYIHAFLDGRDTPPKSASTFTKNINDYMSTLGIGEIKTMIGRAYAMDRSETWERTQLAYNLIAEGIGNNYNSCEEAIDIQYKREITDEFVKPCVIGKYEGIRNSDVLIFLNYRADRAIQLTKAFYEENFNKFPVKREKQYLFLAMNQYEKDLPKSVIFPKDYVKLPIGRVVSEANLTQLRIAETEKFPHVTYFFNGGAPIKYQGEEDIEIPSQKVDTYDNKPEMSSIILTDKILSEIKSDSYNFIVANFANGDMVGHTGNIDATIKAVKYTDECVGRIVSQYISMGGDVIITADHGNCEEMVNTTTGEMDTEHSINPVPFIYINQNTNLKLMRLGKLSDVAPTILKIFGITKPSEMSGISLI